MNNKFDAGKVIEEWDRWVDGGAATAIATLERQAAASEAWASNSSHKGGKRKALALADAKELRAKAHQLRVAAGLV